VSSESQLLKRGAKKKKKTVIKLFSISNSPLVSSQVLTELYSIVVDCSRAAEKKKNLPPSLL
jgi:predicted nucleic acid-binding protein